MSAPVSYDPRVGAELDLSEWAELVIQRACAR